VRGIGRLIVVAALPVALLHGRSARAAAVGETLELAAGQESIVNTGRFEGIAIDEPTVVSASEAGPEHVRIVGRIGGQALVHVFLADGLRTYVVRVKAVDPPPRRRRGLPPGRRVGSPIGDYRVIGTQQFGAGGGRTDLQHLAWFSAPMADGVMRFAAEAGGGLGPPELRRALLAYRRGPYEGRLGDSTLALGELGPRQSLELRGVEAELNPNRDTVVTAFSGTVADHRRYFTFSPANVFGARAEGKLDQQRIEWQARALVLELDRPAPAGVGPGWVGDQSFTEALLRVHRPWGLVEAETAVMPLGAGGRARVINRRNFVQTELGAEWVKGAYLDMSHPEDRMGRQHAYLRSTYEAHGLWQPQLSLGAGQETFDTTGPNDSRARFTYASLGTTHMTRPWLQSRANGQVTLSRAQVGDAPELGMAAYSLAAGAVARGDERQLALDGLWGLTRSGREDRLNAGARLYGERTFHPDDEHLRVSAQLDYSHLSRIEHAGPGVPAQHGIMLSGHFERSLGNVLALGGAGLGYASVVGAQGQVNGRFSYDPRPQHRLEAGLAVTFDARAGATGSVMFSYTHRFGVATPEQPPFEIYADGEISGRVFIDENRNGQYDPGEKPLADVGIALDNGGQTRRTDASGCYRFASVRAGAHLITIDGKTVPVHSRFTTPSPAQVTVAEERKIPADFGLSWAGEMVGRVVNDRDGDGVAGVSEPGLAGVHLTIQGEGATLSTVTNGYGYYRVEGLDPGAYRVVVDEGTLPTGYQLVKGGEAATEVGAQGLARVDFMGGALRAVAGVVYRDSNWNGTRDADEVGAAGVSVFCGTGQVKTDARGRYMCRGLPAGALMVGALAAEGTRAPEAAGRSVTLPDEPAFIEHVDVALEPTYEALGQAPLPFDRRTGRLGRGARAAVARIAALARAIPAPLVLELRIEAPPGTHVGALERAVAEARALLGGAQVPEARLRATPGRIDVAGRSPRIVVRAMKGGG
jgi:SdrD B-like domain